MPDNARRSPGSASTRLPNPPRKPPGAVAISRHPRSPPRHAPRVAAPRRGASQRKNGSGRSSAPPGGCPAGLTPAGRTCSTVRTSRGWSLSPRPRTAWPFPASLVGALGRDLTASPAVPGLSDVPSRRYRPLPPRSLAPLRPAITLLQDRAGGTPRGPAADCGGMRTEARQRLVSLPAGHLLLEPTGIRPGGTGLPQVDCTLPRFGHRVPKHGVATCEEQGREGGGRGVQGSLSGSVRTARSDPLPAMGLVLWADPPRPFG